MKCPAATKISIQLVQYGRLTPDDGLCPANIRYPGPRPSITGTEDRHQQVGILNTGGGGDGGGGSGGSEGAGGCGGGGVVEVVEVNVEVTDSWCLGEVFDT